jgi:hypothetical protein
MKLLLRRDGVVSADMENVPTRDHAIPSPYFHCRLACLGQADPRPSNRAQDSPKSDHRVKFLVEPDM